MDGAFERVVSSSGAFDVHREMQLSASGHCRAGVLQKEPNIRRRNFKMQLKLLVNVPLFNMVTVRQSFTFTPKRCECFPPHFML